MSFRFPRIIWKMIVECVLFSKVQHIFEGLGELTENSDIFENAKEINFYAGELYFDFYDNPKFIEALSHSIENGCKVSAVFGPALYVDDSKFLKLACKNKNVRLFKRSSRDPAHFKVIERKDGKTLAIVDKPHPINIDKDVRGSVLLVKGYDAEVQRCKSKFEREMQRAKPIEVKNILEEFSNRGVDEDGNFYGFITKRSGTVEIASQTQIDELRSCLEHNCA